MAAARAVLQGPPAVAEVNQEAAAAFGLVVVMPEPPPAPVCEVWAELWPAVQTFERVRNQWRSGPGGAYALDYSVLPARARPGAAGRRGLSLFEQLQVMEAEALRWFDEQRQKLAG